LEAWIAAREEAAPALAIFFNASLNAELLWESLAGETELLASASDFIDCPVAATGYV
jgi:hypothetical protein